MDSGCANYMTHHEMLSKELDRSQVSKFRIGNSDLIVVEGKCIIVIQAMDWKEKWFHDSSSMI